MRTIRLTMARALVRYLTMQKILIEGLEEPLFPGVFAIFGAFSRFPEMDLSTLKILPKCWLKSTIPAG